MSHFTSLWQPTRTLLLLLNISSYCSHASFWTWKIVQQWENANLLHALSSQKKVQSQTVIFWDVTPYNLLHGLTVFRRNLLPLADSIAQSVQWLGYGFENGRNFIWFLAGVRDFSLIRNVQTDSGSHPASYSMDTGGSSPGVMRPGRQAGYSPPSSTEAKNKWTYTATPSICLRGVRRDSFTFLPLPPASIYPGFLHRTVCYVVNSVSEQPVSNYSRVVTSYSLRDC
jgi:hypothetical protein